MAAKGLRETNECLQAGADDSQLVIDMEAPQSIVRRTQLIAWVLCIMCSLPYVDGAPERAISFHSISSTTPDPTRSVGHRSADGLHAWVIEYALTESPQAQRLIYTNDAGQTWNEFVSDEVKTIREIRFLHSRGWIMDDANQVFETTDRGRRWTRGPKSSRLPLFWDARSGIRLIEVPEEDGRWRGKFEIHYTSDSGATWQRCACDFRRIEYWPMALSVSTRGAAIRGLLVRMDEQQPHQMLGKFSSGGCVWDRGSVALPDPDEYFSTAYFIDQKRGWIAGGATGSLYRTDDGGKSWRDLSIPESHRRVESVYFDTIDLGWMLAMNDDYLDKQLFRSTDGGRSWHLVPPNAIVTTRLPSDWQEGNLYQFLAKNRLQK